jgi:TolB-like protein
MLAEESRTTAASVAALISELRRATNTEREAEGTSIAVLPFANMSVEKENEYSSDGLAEEIINALTQIPNLSVVARTSSFAFRGKEQDIRGIGEVLKVAKILEGSVRKAGNRMRVTAQLSPEQTRGKMVDKRADVWAFGVVLYEMVTGKPLFEGQDLTETLASVLMKEPDLTAAPIQLREH